MKVLEFDNVHGSYRGGEEVLSGVSFSIEEGQVVGLLGKNGAGKTTLIHIAMGMFRPQEGTVHLFGLDPQEDPVPIKRRVGFVSENQILPPAMSSPSIRFLMETRGAWPTLKGSCGRLSAFQSPSSTASILAPAFEPRCSSLRIRSRPALRGTEVRCGFPIGTTGSISAAACLRSRTCRLGALTLPRRSSSL